MKYSATPGPQSLSFGKAFRLRKPELRRKSPCHCGKPMRCVERQGPMRRPSLRPDAYQNLGSLSYRKPLIACDAPARHFDGQQDNDPKAQEPLCAKVLLKPCKYNHLE